MVNNDPIPRHGIHFSTMQNLPTYPLKSVDHALHAAALLQQEGPQRVVDVAERLRVSPSTAHRLLAMLVYREFATQGPDKRYHPGPVLNRVDRVESSAAILRRVAGPHMQWLVDLTNETSNLIVPVGTEARFIKTVECDQVLRVTDRTGRSKPLHLTSGGRAILAAMEAEQVSELYSGDSAIDVPALHHELSRIRTSSFAINDQQTEKGLTALGAVLRDSTGRPCAALALSMPTVRFRAETVRDWVSRLLATAGRIERDLADEAALQL